jgi:hypothetical protein
LKKEQHLGVQQPDVVALELALGLAELLVASFAHEERNLFYLNPAFELLSEFSKLLSASQPLLA